MIVGLARLMAACALAGVLCVGPAHAVPPMSAAAAADAETWARLKDSEDIAALRAFAEKPRNRFASQARLRIRQLDAEAPPPPPGADPKAALAAMLRFDSVAQMRAVAPPAAPSAQPVQLASSVQEAPRAPPPAQAPPTPAPVPAPPPATGAAPTIEAGEAATPQPSPPAEPVAPAPPPRVYADVATAAPSRPATPVDPLARPPMRLYDKPVLPVVFCKQEDMNSYLTDFHKPLYAAAWANNEDASRHMNELNVVFGAAKAASGPGATDRVLRVGDELQAYTKEADDRFKAAEAIRDLDPLIRKIPIEPRAGCASAPWPQPTKPAPTALAASG